MSVGNILTASGDQSTRIEGAHLSDDKEQIGISDLEPISAQALKCVPRPRHEEKNPILFNVETFVMHHAASRWRWVFPRLGLDVSRSWGWENKCVGRGRRGLGEARATRIRRAQPRIARRPFACLPCSRHAGKFKARLPGGQLHGSHGSL